jgi:sucrose-6-phosphate hydrolase SacC (GH32 family)
VVDFAAEEMNNLKFREKLLSDPYRPGYHFIVPEGRCMPFDPNGAIYWQGRYHLFYIFQDKRGHNWGRVSSTDLFHWLQARVDPIRAVGVPLAICWGTQNQVH